MKNIDRRQWLKAVGITGSMALIANFDALALELQSTRKNTTTTRLNANENPYGPSQKVRDAIQKSFDEACRYPFRYLSSLVDLLAEKEGVSPDHIVVTGGSTEGLKACGLTFGLNRGEIIAADPTFQALLRYAERFGGHVHRVPLNDKLEHDLEAMEKRVTGKTRLIFLCNPNNPTGTILEKNKLYDFCKSMAGKTMVFSDEAYYDFITDANYPSMVELVKEDYNVIVSKTFSKVYGLAGMRIGYLIARPDVALRLRNNIMAMTNVLAIEAAKQALKDDEFYKMSLIKNEEAKTYIYKKLDELSLPYVRSHTNFVFFKSGRDIHKMVEAMGKHNVVIGRPFPPMYDWVRISTGTMEQMKNFGDALSKVMA